jgi:hypothetical protein
MPGTSPSQPVTEYAPLPLDGRVQERTAREASTERARGKRLIIESSLIVLSVLLGFAANQWHDRAS